MAYGTLSDLSSYLTEGYWSDISQTYRKWNLSETGINAKSGEITYSLGSNWYDTNGINSNHATLIHYAFQYLENIKDAASLIDSNLFRPPYGRITKKQIRAIHSNPDLPQQIIMWDVLSGDFDTTITGDQCAQNVIQHAGPGSIIVFHDSAKAMDRLRVALPKVLSHFSKQGYQFKAL